MLIEILSTPTCPFCTSCEFKLKKATQGTEIEVKRINDFERVKELGFRSVPIVLKDGEFWYRGDALSLEEIKQELDL